MLSEDAITIIWLGIFFVVFYFYVDQRISKLRKEVLYHYALLEKLIIKSDKLNSQPNGRLIEPFLVTESAEQDSEYSHIKLLNTDLSNDPNNENFRYQCNKLPHSVNDLIPTKEEMKKGLESMDSVSSERWLTANQNTQQKIDFQPYQDSDYASFNIESFL